MNQKLKLDINKLNVEMLRALSVAFGRYISEENPQLLFEYLLNKLLELTLSEYGFIGRVLRADDEKPYLKTYAITNISWNDETQALYESQVNKGMEFHNLDTLFGACLKTQKPVIANDPGKDPRRGGTPTGHPDLNSFLGIPLLQGKDMIGMAGIANRPGGYDKHIIQQFQPFFQTCSNLIYAYTQFELRTIAENELRSMNEMFTAFLEAASEGIGFVDTNGKIQNINKKIVEMFGYSQDELINQPVEILIPERYRKRHVDHRSGYIRNPFPRSMGTGLDISGKRKDGSEFPIDVGLSYINLGDGLQSMFFITDISRQKHYEDSLQQAHEELESKVNERTKELKQINLSLQAEMESREQAERADLLKTQFVSDVTHELRTPLSILTLISGNLDMLYNQLDDSKRHQMIQEIRAHAQIMNDLIGDVLEISRLDDGRISKDRELLDLSQIVEEVINEQSPLAQKKQQALNFSATEHLHILANNEHVSRVIRNIIHNAIKYTSEGGEICCESKKCVGGGPIDEDWPGCDKLSIGNWAGFCIRDNGVGISEEDLNRIYDRFYRVETQSNIPGTGLGLSIAQDLIYLNHGYIFAYSEPGVGSKFAIYLPLMDEVIDGR
jgi:PAS domain S-box-containing protein